MNDLALNAITDALKNCVDIPRLIWPECEKAEITFSKWALEESLLLVWDHPFTPASETIETFATKLGIYAEMAVTEEQNLIFNIAADTVWTILDEIKRLEF